MSPLKTHNHFMKKISALITFIALGKQRKPGVYIPAQTVLDLSQN